MSRPCKNNPTGAQEKTKQTQEVLGLLKHAFSIGSTDKEACIYAGISETTFYDWKKDDVKLSDEFDRLKLEPILQAKQTIINGLDDPLNAKWYLERKLKNEFSLKLETEHSGILQIKPHEDWLELLDE